MDLEKSGETTKVDTRAESLSPSDAIDPDKLIEPGTVEIPTSVRGEEINPDELICPKEYEVLGQPKIFDKNHKDDSNPKGLTEIGEPKLYSTRGERIAFAEHNHGEWSGDPGNSDFTPSNPDARKALAEFGETSVPYRDGVVDFSKVSKETVRIEMTSDIFVNHRRAYAEIAKKWNEQRKDNRVDWTQRDVERWKKENNLDMHECNDQRTMQFVPARIHETCKHLGGRYEIRCKENKANGVFDE